MARGLTVAEVFAKLQSSLTKKGRRIMGCVNSAMVIVSDGMSIFRVILKYKRGAWSIKAHRA